jgi:REP element-mobilizing transposase RayT
MNKDSDLEITRRRLPHWKLDGSVYFITFRVLQGELSPVEQQIAFDHIASGDPQFFRLFAWVVMPDHVHLLLKPNPGMDLSQVMKGLKGVSARKINKHRGTKGHVWQDESYDRIIRDEEEFLLKLNYIALNPKKAGLVSGNEAYPFLRIYLNACFPAADKNVCPTE